MTSPDSRLRHSMQGRRSERDRRIRAIGRQFDPITRRLEERLLGIVAANRGGQDGVIGSVDVVLTGMIPDLAAEIEKGLRELWLWSWRSATRAVIRALPLRFWAARHVGVKTLVTEGQGNHEMAAAAHAIALSMDTLRTGWTDAIDEITDALRQAGFQSPTFTEDQPTRVVEAEPPEYDFGPEDQLLRIIQGEVDQQEAREIVRQLEFPPLSEEQVSRIIDATEAHDGMSAMQRIRTVESGRLGELRDLIVEGYSHVDGAATLAWLTPRLKDLVGGINYRAKRIARTEGVRIAEAGLRESWDNCTDLMDGVQWFSARVPRSRPDHVARHNKVYRRTSGGWIADDGESLPPIPLGPNCLCWTSPVLAEDIVRGLPDADYGTYDVARRRFKQEKADLERPKPKPKRKPKAPPKPKVKLHRRPPPAGPKRLSAEERIENAIGKPELQLTKFTREYGQDTAAGKHHLDSLAEEVERCAMHAGKWSDKVTVKRIELIDRESWGNGVRGQFQLTKDKITIAARKLNGDQTLRVGKGAWMVSDSVRSCIRHEYGHALHFEVHMLLQPSHEWTEIWRSETKEAWAEQVSTYGATNAQELFAESFAAWSHPNYGKRGNILPPQIHDFFTKWIK